MGGRGESDHVQVYSVENWGQRDRQSFTWAMVAGDLETETEKAEKNMGDARARFHALSVTGMGIWSWLCVFVGFFKQIRRLLLKVIFQN